MDLCGAGWKEGEGGGMNWEIGVDIDTPPLVNICFVGRCCIEHGVHLGDEGEG